jgi:hypothetical protein
MPTEAPVSHHLDLYAYWQAKRGARSMPARSDLDPADLIPLLPYLIIAEKGDDQFRYRLFGTGVVGDLGYDATGYIAGEYLNNPYFYAELRAIYEAMCTLCNPVFATGEFCFKSFKSGALYASSTLILPLSDDGITINKAISSLIACLHSDPASNPDWLKQQPIKVFRVTAIGGAAELERLCREWEQRCTPVAKERLASS